jgi:hypothetical protein
MGCNCGKNTGNLRPDPRDVQAQREATAAQQGDSRPTPAAPPATGDAK